MEDRKICSSATFEQDGRQRKLPCLHSACNGTEQDVAAMEIRLQQYPHLLEFVCKLKQVTPLVAAVLSGHELCVEFLLKKGANVHTISSMSKNFGTQTLVIAGTALSLATFFFCEQTESKLKILSLLLEYGSDPNSIINCRDEIVTPLTSLVINNSVEYLKLLLKFGMVTNYSKFHSYEKDMDENLNPIIGAICCKHLDCLKVLLLNSIDQELNVEYEKIGKNKLLLPNFIMNLKCLDKINNSKCLKMLHKFGSNLWEGHEVIRPGDSEKSQQLYAELKRLRSRPLSLKELGRVAVLRTMGRRFVEHSDSLELPASLHTFLKFPDVDT